MRRNIILMIAGVSSLAACKKTHLEVPLYSSLLAVNAAINMPSMRAVATDQSFTWAGTGSTNTIAFTRQFQIGALAGNQNISVVSAADTNQLIFNTVKAEAFKANTFNTLFICGNTGAYEGIFINDDTLVNHTDSVIGIRFINLSPNSSPVSITLATSPTVNEATGLAYKQRTAFKTYPATGNTGNMVFQVRDAGGTILANYTIPITPVSPYTTVGIAWARFNNLTLVIKGLQGTTSGTNAFGIFPVVHY